MKLVIQWVQPKVYNLQFISNSRFSFFYLYLYTVKPVYNEQVGAAKSVRKKRVFVITDHFIKKSMQWVQTICFVITEFVINEFNCI